MYWKHLVVNRLNPKALINLKNIRSLTICCFVTNLLVSNSLFINRRFHTEPNRPLVAQTKNSLSINSYPTFPNMLNASIDKSLFEKTLPLIALKIPSKLCASYLEKFKDHLFLRPRSKRIHNIPDDNSYRLLLLSEKIVDVDLSKGDIPQELVEFHFANNQQPDAVQVYPYPISYEHFSTEEVLEKVLLPQISKDRPDVDLSTIEIPSSFEQAGHIAHMNLREDMLPYKYTIGQIILDKNVHIKTVINKVGQIETQFRTFPLEVIAGEEDFLVTLKESNALFRFNFAEVYWNSRLQMEHGRMIGIISDSAKQREQPLIVADMMAGVGPFAIPLAKVSLAKHESLREPAKKKQKKDNDKKEVSGPNLVVYANDLNPASYRYLVENIQLNHIPAKTSLFPFNLDAREFLVNLVEKEKKWPDEVLMNLPQNAVEFLDCFIGCGSRYNKFAEPTALLTTESKMPRIHVYAFSTCMESPVMDVAERAASYLKCSVDLVRESQGFSGHIVRDVAPKKVMVCLSFSLPHQVAFESI